MSDAKYPSVRYIVEYGASYCYEYAAMAMKEHPEFHLIYTNDAADVQMDDDVMFGDRDADVAESKLTEMIMRHGTVSAVQGPMINDVMVEFMPVLVMVDHRNNMLTPSPDIIITGFLTNGESSVLMVDCDGPDVIEFNNALATKDDDPFMWTMSTERRMRIKDIIDTSRALRLL